MHDEFRLKVRVQEPRELLAALKAVEPGGGGDHGLGRVAVTHEQDHIFLYCDSQDAAQQARTMLERTLAEKQLTGEISLWRWHPLEERWEDASAPLPVSDADRAAELERRRVLEEQCSQQTGQPEWEVRITVPSHEEARTFVERLEAEGIPVTQRWRHLLVGANSEDEALALAERLRSEAPAGSEIVPEGSGALAWNLLHPFAIFGGIAN